VLPLTRAVYTLGVGVYLLLAGWWQGGEPANTAARMLQLMLLLAPGLAAILVFGALAMVGGKKTQG